MALTPTYEHDATFKKLTVNGSVYWVKDADLRTLVESFGQAVYKDVATEVTAEGLNLTTSKAVYDYVTDAISDLEGVMHFRGVLTGRQEGETDAQMLARLVADPEAGDVVIIQDNGKEYIYGSSAWEEVGDQNIYLTIASAAATYVPLTRTIAGIDLQDNISVEELSASTALNLKALSHKDTASGTVEVVDTADDLTVGKAGEYEVVAGTTVAVPLTFNAMDVTPAGSVSLTAGTAAAATYQKTSGVTVSAGAVGDGQTANYTPAGNVSLPTISAGVTLQSTNVATVTDAGTAYTLTDGAVSQAADTTAKVVKKAVDFTVNAADEELVLSYVANTDTTFYADAVTASGAVTYTAPALSGSLPTFGTQAVALTTGASATATYDGDATFSGTGVVLGATPAYETANAVVTQPTFTAEFSGTSASVTPTAATTSNALASGSVTVASETKSITLNKKNSTVTVS